MILSIVYTLLHVYSNASVVMQVKSHISKQQIGRCQQTVVCPSAFCRTFARVVSFRSRQT
ncbi:hypothetical protein T12_4233 [Trichinella patagoniensis]|uniref:Uncharacterized protein n=1 Tax=Trichinella patagoniensis TaxID=990121 RepID=A0A0V0Z7T1_9BILA|nr:hypothetical protein T12_4233 [Trichinella patagoniensis]